MFNLRGKTAVVAGGSGLIGSAILTGLQSLNAECYNCDPAADTDNFGTLFEKLKVDIFVNASYPKDWLEHLMCFHDYSEGAAKHMAKNWGGSIVNLASIYGVLGPKDSIYAGTGTQPTPETYAMVKGAIISHSRLLATRYAWRNVRVNCISPGGVYHEDMSDLFVSNYNNRVPLGYMAEPQDIARAVCWLASDEYITGQNIIIDGGLTAW